jgi:hypothetical protein
MESLLKWFKEKWVWMLGALGVFVIALGAVFGRKKVADDKTTAIHESKMLGIESAKQIEEDAKEAISQAHEEYDKKNLQIENDKQAKTENLKKMEQVDLTEAIADKFNFKNGDKQ